MHRDLSQIRRIKDPETRITAKVDFIADILHGAGVGRNDRVGHPWDSPASQPQVRLNTRANVDGKTTPRVK